MYVNKKLIALKSLQIVASTMTLVSHPFFPKSNLAILYLRALKGYCDSKSETGDTDFKFAVSVLNRKDEKIT